MNSAILDAALQNPIPITGTFNPATGEITFVEGFPAGAIGARHWPNNPFFFPSYDGFQVGGSGLAGIKSRIQIVRIGQGLAPGGYTWERVNSGWAAFFVQ